MTHFVTRPGLKGHVYHDGTQMIVINEGQPAKIPAADLDRLVEEGIVARDQLDHDDDGGRGGSKKGPASTRSKGAAKKLAEAGSLDPAPFAVKSVPVGKYEITGPGLDAAIIVKGKTKMQARVAELQAGLAPAADAPVD
ncbi:MAG: hypothetical protein QOH47_2410 [Sphingomonadales bacterium]|jgi:hypothetical protein|nr:hypothetical protein [Sphingomonadales bacterium]